MIHLIYRDRARWGHFKGYQFGRVSMREHWQCGLADIGRALARPEWLRLPDGEESFVTHDATAPDRLQGGLSAKGAKEREKGGKS